MIEYPGQVTAICISECSLIDWNGKAVATWWVGRLKAHFLRSTSNSPMPFWPLALSLSLSSLTMRTKAAKKGAYRQNRQGRRRLYCPLNGTCHLDILYLLDGAKCAKNILAFNSWLFVKSTLAEEEQRSPLHPQDSWRWKNTIIYCAWIHRAKANLALLLRT